MAERPPATLNEIADRHHLGTESKGVYLSPTMAWIIVRMEDLSDCMAPVILDRIATLVFSDRGPRDYPEGALATSFLRLVDKAIISHELARREFDASNESRSFATLLRGQGHLETCIGSAHRALLFAERLRARGLVREDGRPLIPRASDYQCFQLTPANESETCETR